MPATQITTITITTAKIHLSTHASIVGRAIEEEHVQLMERNVENALDQIILRVSANLRDK